MSNTEYNFTAIEKKWQAYWAAHETFKTDVWDFSKPKFYALDMFPKDICFLISSTVAALRLSSAIAWIVLPQKRQVMVLPTAPESITAPHEGHTSGNMGLR